MKSFLKGICVAAGDALVARLEVLLLVVVVLVVGLIDPEAVQSTWENDWDIHP